MFALLILQLVYQEQPFILKGKKSTDLNIQFYSGGSNNPGWTGGAGVLSEMGTVQLEFAYLAHHTKKPHYREKVRSIFNMLLINKGSQSF